MFIIMVITSSFNHADEIRKVRFGFLDQDSNFSLIYEEGESDNSLYPGDLKQRSLEIYVR